MKVLSHWTVVSHAFHLTRDWIGHKATVTMATENKTGPTVWTQHYYETDWRKQPNTPVTLNIFSVLYFFMMPEFLDE